MLDYACAHIYMYMQRVTLIKGFTSYLKIVRSVNQ